MFQRIRLFLYIWWRNDCSISMAWWLAGNVEKFCEDSD